MTHAWCSDPARDAAVRAAEDCRDRPLPTLEQAIAAPFANASERSVPVSETGEGQSGMRTERVTLEVVHGAIASVNDQRWWDSRLWIEPQKGESVRVVDEPLSDAWAQRLNRLTAELDAAIRERDQMKARLSRVLKSSDSMWSKILVVGAERDKLRARVAELEAAAKLAPRANDDGGSNHAAQPASGGGEGEPVVWGFATPDGKLVHVSTFEPDPGTATVIPLYRAPPQPRGWLTEGERGALLYAIDGLREASSARNHAHANTLESILDRSSPPEVVLPVADCSWCSDYATVWRECLEAVRSSLAAAGVAVKETT